jgi:hypothetical protein
MQCQALGYRTGAEVTAELGELPPDELLPLGAQEMIFRIVQEGFANIARHARASHVWLSLQQQRNALLVEIGDDGQGFDLAQANELPNTYGGMGLSNVRERASTLGGTLAIWSLPGRGTTLHLYIPLAKPLLQAQEEERRNQELATVVHKAHRILRTGQWAAELAAVLILLYMPASIAIWLALICIIVALASWLWAQQYRLQLALDFGREHAEHLALLAESYGLLSGSLLLCMLYVNYFYPIEFPPKNGWLVSGFFGVFITAIVATYARYAGNIDRYYKALAREALQERMRRQLQEMAIDWIAWVIVVVLTVFLLSVLPGTANGTLLSGEQVMGLVLLCAWFLVILLKSLRIARWYNVLRLWAKRATHDEEGSIV